MISQDDKDSLQLDEEDFLKEQENCKTEFEQLLVYQKWTLRQFLRLNDKLELLAMSIDTIHDVLEKIRTRQ